MVNDDNSKMRANLKNLQNGWKLQTSTPEPKFLCEPGHRIKTMTKKIFEMVEANKDLDDIKKIDALRINKYLSYYVYQSRSGDLNELINNSAAPI